MIMVWLLVLIAQSIAIGIGITNGSYQWRAVVAGVIVALALQQIGLEYRGRRGETA